MFVFACRLSEDCAFLEDPLPQRLLPMNTKTNTKPKPSAKLKPNAKPKPKTISVSHQISDFQPTPLPMSLPKKTCKLFSRRSEILVFSFCARIFFFFFFLFFSCSLQFTFHFVPPADVRPASRLRTVCRRTADIPLARRPRHLSL